MENTWFYLARNAPQLYARYTFPNLALPQTKLMFAHVSLHAGNRVSDAACGTVIVTHVAVQRWGNLGHSVGVDLNPSMLDAAHANTPAMGIPIAWLQGDLCALPFSPSSFGVVWYKQGLQYAQDTLEALRGIRWVLVPEGQFAFTVWSASPYVVGMVDALTCHLSSAVAARCCHCTAWCTHG